jgi:hypothetical protein
MTNDEYLAQQGWKCPCCANDEINILRVDGRHIMKPNVNNTKIRRLVRCTKCKVEYWDIYELTGWSPHTPGDEEDRSF